MFLVSFGGCWCFGGGLLFACLRFSVCFHGFIGNNTERFSGAFPLGFCVCFFFLKVFWVYV